MFLQSKMSTVQNLLMSARMRDLSPFLCLVPEDWRCQVFVKFQISSNTYLQIILSGNRLISQRYRAKLAPGLLSQILSKQLEKTKSNKQKAEDNWSIKLAIHDL